MLEPDKHVVALADAYFFSPFQPSLLPRTKGGAVIPSNLPPRCARIVVYNKKTNETSIWIVELSQVHAVTRRGHHRGKVISSQVVPDAQPPMVCSSVLVASDSISCHCVLVSVFETNLITYCPFNCVLLPRNFALWYFTLLHFSFVYK